jgi:hypothetical protein
MAAETAIKFLFCLGLIARKGSKKGWLGRSLEI